METIIKKSTQPKLPETENELTKFVMALITLEKKHYCLLFTTTQKIVFAYLHGGKKCPTFFGQIIQKTAVV